MIRISFKDAQNWTSISGEVVNWQNLHDLFKNSRVQPAFLAPEIITDNWNGKNFDVQHIIYDVFEINFFIKESEINKLMQIKSCRKIIFSDVKNGIKHEIDNDSSDLLVVSEPEKVSDTSNFVVTIKYRVNKIIVDKASLIIYNKNALVIKTNDGTSISTNTFYTDFDVLDIQEKSKVEDFTNENGINITSKVISKKIKQVLFFLDFENANILRKEFERAQDITINGLPILENREVKYSEIGNNLVKIIIECLIEVEIFYPLNV